IRKGNRETIKTRIVVEDDEGRAIDLHALRTTLGTQLARAGVTPQVAQRIMRHSDYRTTLKHYTVLGLTDTSASTTRPCLEIHSNSIHLAAARPTPCLPCTTCSPASHQPVLAVWHPC
ncbi:MAG: tyrosine-type recombinase/integrase, partial [Chloroflexi bacterium]|nr:tyrosine-type recombinase/integrase [Chloroflexota bacterium]